MKTNRRVRIGNRRSSLFCRVVVMAILVVRIGEVSDLVFVTVLLYRSVKWCSSK